jgi:hypothetical protein
MCNKNYGVYKRGEERYAVAVYSSKEKAQAKAYGANLARGWFEDNYFVAKYPEKTGRSVNVIVGG